MTKGSPDGWGEEEPLGRSCTWCTAALPPPVYVAGWGGTRDLGAAQHSCACHRPLRRCWWVLPLAGGGERGGCLSHLRPHQQ
jgi:hypothetical protein